MTYWGEQTCDNIVKSTQKQCTNQAYYIKDNKLLCGVHSKKDNRTVLPKNPNKDKIEKENYERHLKTIKQVAKHHFTKAHINWWYNENEKISFMFGGQLNSRKEYDVRRNSHKPIIDLDLYTFDYLLEWEHSLNENANGLIGFQFFNQDNDNNPGTGTTAFIPSV